MTLLSGCYIYTVDDKNRVSMPVKFRENLTEHFIITKGPDGCLWVLSTDQWEKIIARARDSTVVQRFFLASATETSVCPKGRFLLPDILRKHADIKPGDEVAIVGLVNRVEIWSARRWEAANSQLTSDRIRQELPEFFDLL